MREAKHIPQKPSTVDLDTSQASSHTPEHTLDDELVLFSRNAEILTLNRLSFMGLGAREGQQLCRHNPMEKPQLFQHQPLQTTYNRFLHRTWAAGHNQDSSDPWLAVYLEIYKSYAQRRSRNHDELDRRMGDKGLHVRLLTLGDRIIELRREFFEAGQTLTADDMASVRLFDERVVTAADRRLMEVGRLLDSDPDSSGPILHGAIFDAYAALPEWRPRRLPFVSALFLEEGGQGG